MKQTLLLAGLLIAATALAPAAASAEPGVLDIHLLGGYSFVSNTLFDVRSDECFDQKRSKDIDDDSRLDPGFLYGVGVSLFPTKGFVQVAFGAELFYARTEGKLKGNAELDGERRAYDFGTRLETGQLYLNVKLMFGNKAFRPYGLFGAGVAYTQYTVSQMKQDNYAGCMNLAWGFDFWLGDRISLGLQLRFTDLLPHRYWYEPDEANLYKVEIHHLPVSGLIDIGFHF